MESPVPPQASSPPKSGLAIAGLVCGILAPFTCAGTSLPAIILGHIGLSKITASRGAVGGKKSAIWALVLGYGSILLIPLIAALAGLAAPLVLKKTREARELSVVFNTQALSTALRAYNTELGTDTAPYPSDIHELESRGYIDSVEEALTVHGIPSGEWLYFWAADSLDGSAPLLITPLFYGKHIVMRVDGSASDLTAQEVIDLVGNSQVPPHRIPAPIGRSSP